MLTAQCCDACEFFPDHAICDSGKLCPHRDHSTAGFSPAGPQIRQRIPRILFRALFAEASLPKATPIRKVARCKMARELSWGEVRAKHPHLPASPWFFSPPKVVAPPPLHGSYPRGESVPLPPRLFGPTCAPSPQQGSEPVWQNLARKQIKSFISDCGCREV